MTAIDEAKLILETMISHLGFIATVEIEEVEGAEALQVHLEDAEGLVGANAERLEDLQYLVNRLLQQKQPDAPRIKVDVAHFRGRKEDQLIETVRTAANHVRTTGLSVKLDPMNSYQRRVVHNLLVDDPDVKSWSPDDASRLKSISLVPRIDSAS
jgi:spoIIIJ-associated protein